MLPRRLSNNYIKKINRAYFSTQILKNQTTQSVQLRKFKPGYIFPCTRETDKPRAELMRIDKPSVEAVVRKFEGSGLANMVRYEV